MDDEGETKLQTTKEMAAAFSTSKKKRSENKSQDDY